MAFDDHNGYEPPNFWEFYPHGSISADHEMLLVLKYFRLVMFVTGGRPWSLPRSSLTFTLLQEFCMTVPFVVDNSDNILEIPPS
jgi:hypothetical protein